MQLPMLGRPFWRMRWLPASEDSPLIGFRTPDGPKYRVHSPLSPLSRRLEKAQRRFVPQAVVGSAHGRSERHTRCIACRCSVPQSQSLFANGNAQYSPRRVVIPNIGDDSDPQVVQQSPTDSILSTRRKWPSDRISTAPNYSSAGPNAA